MSDSTATPPPVTAVPIFAAPSGTDKIWAIVSHVSLLVGFPFIIPIVIYLAMRHESDYVVSNAREALNFHISLLIYSLFCLPFVFILVGVPLLVLGGIAAVILTVVAAIKASDNGCYHYPLTIRLIK